MLKLEVIMDTRRHYGNQEVITELAIQMAHDIRSPLSALLAVISHPGHFDENKRRMALRATHRVQEIAEELMSHYRKVQVVKEEEALEVNIATIIEQMIEEKRLTLPNTIRINTAFAGSVFKHLTFTRSREFKRILSNIMNNAVEAIYKKAPHGEIKIILKGENERLHLCIQDDGCGIPEEILEKIGQRGYSWKKKNGHGLGLYRARKMIELWGGSLVVESIYGEGTKVKMEF
jgi:signal transduction histidine kinase